MTAPAQEIDPFAGGTGEKSPAISFKGAAIGTVITMTVTDSPKKIQGKEFGTENPAVWPDGNPKYSAVINGTVDGEPRSVWAQIPSDLFAKLKDAQTALGRSVRNGDTLAIKLTDEVPGKGNAKKVYAVKITPGTPAASPESDPFAGLPGANAENAAKWDDQNPPW